MSGTMSVSTTVEVMHKRRKRQEERRAAAWAYLHRNTPEPPTILPGDGDGWTGMPDIALEAYIGFPDGRFRWYDVNQYPRPRDGAAIRMANAWNEWADARSLPKRNWGSLQTYRHYCAIHNVPGTPRRWYEMNGLAPPKGAEE